MRQKPSIGYSRTKSGLLIERAAAVLHRYAVNQQSAICQPQECRVTTTKHEQRESQVVFL